MERSTLRQVFGVLSSQRSVVLHNTRCRDWSDWTGGAHAVLRLRALSYPWVFLDPRFLWVVEDEESERDQFTIDNGGYR